MQIDVTFRHMDSSEPVRQYAEEKIGRLRKYIDEPIDAHVVVSVDKKIRNTAEVTMVAKGITIRAKETTADMYAAIDAVSDKLDRQLKRYKEKIKKHKPASERARRVQKTVVAAESVDESHVEPQIIRSSSFSVKPMSVEEAVMQMDLLHKDFLVYTDSTTEHLSVVYRRDDGNYGLIAPEAVQA